MPSIIIINLRIFNFFWRVCFLIWKVLQNLRFHQLILSSVSGILALSLSASYQVDTVFYFIQFSKEANFERKKSPELCSNRLAHQISLFQSCFFTLPLGNRVIVENIAPSGPVIINTKGWGAVQNCDRAWKYIWSLCALLNRPNDLLMGYQILYLLRKIPSWVKYCSCIERYIKDSGEKQNISYNLNTYTHKILACSYDFTLAFERTI